MNFGEFIDEASKEQGNRLPFKSNKSIERKDRTGHASEKSPIKSKPGGGRKGTVKQPKGHPAAKRNQAYGGESEEQYNPPKYKQIKRELRDNGGKGQIMVPGKPPYKKNPLAKKHEIVRGNSDKVQKLIDGPGGKDAVENLKKKALEKAYKKDAKKGEYPKIEEQRINFTEWLDTLCDPLYEANDKPTCPKGYKWDSKTMMCVPKTPKDDVGAHNDKDRKPENGPGYNVIGSHGMNGAPYAYEEPAQGGE
jgi:hypothetical protein